MARQSFAVRQARAQALGYSGYAEQRRARAAAAAGDRTRLRSGDIPGPERRAAAAAARAAQDAARTAARAARDAARTARKAIRKAPRLKRQTTVGRATVYRSAGNSRTVDRMVRDALDQAIRNRQRISFRLVVGPDGRSGEVQVTVGPPSVHPDGMGLSPIEMQKVLKGAGGIDALGVAIRDVYPTGSKRGGGGGASGFSTLVLSNNSDWAATSIEDEDEDED